MSKIIISEGLSSNISALNNYENSYAEGDTGELRLYVGDSLSEETLQELEGQILSQGVVLTAPISQDARVVIIKFKKAIPPLATIIEAIKAKISEIEGWQLFKTSALGIQIWGWLLGAVGLYVVLRRS